MRQNLVLGFVNDLAEWCGHEGLPLSDRLERVRDALMSVLLDLRRVHLVTTGEPTVSGRRVMSLALLAPRHGLVLGLSRKQVSCRSQDYSQEQVYAPTIDRLDPLQNSF